MDLAYVTDAKEQKPKEREPFLKREIAYGITGAEWVTAGLAGLFSGTVTAVKTIRDRYFHDLKHSVDYKDILDKQTADLAAITPIVNPDKYAGNFEALSRDTVAIKTNGLDTLKQFSKSHRLIDTDKKIEATWRMLKMHSPHSRNKIIVNGVIGSAIGAAVTLNFFNGVATRDRIERIEDAVVPQQQQH